MPQLSNEEYREDRWNDKPRGRWGNTYEKPRDEENCPPNLDYKIIEQIADGVEKMIQAWSHGKKRESHVRRSSALNSAASFPANVLRGLQKPMKIKSPLSEKSFQGEGGCNYVCPVQLQNIPGGMTAEISINGNCPGAGMGSAISQIVSQAVKHTGTVSNKDTYAEKTVTETATYWYLEASNATNQGSRGSSREHERKAESSGRIGGLCNSSKQSCFPDKDSLNWRSWSKEDKHSGPASRCESGGTSEVSPTSSDQNTPQESFSLDNHGSRQHKHKDVESLRSNNSGAAAAAEQPLASKQATPNLILQSETPTVPRHAQANLKEGLEEPRLPRVNLGR